MKGICGHGLKECRMGLCQVGKSTCEEVHLLPMDTHHIHTSLDIQNILNVGSLINMRKENTNKDMIDTNMKS